MLEKYLCTYNSIMLHANLKKLIKKLKKSVVKILWVISSYDYNLLSYIADKYLSTAFII